MFKFLKDSAKECVWLLSSIVICASSYVIAFLERMILLWQRVLKMFASLSISQMQENAKRSSPPRKEHKFELRRSGTYTRSQFTNQIYHIKKKYVTISILLLTRYTVVAREAASRSIAVPGRIKCDTSAICTPTSNVSSSRGLQ